ncbi:MAG TPA: NAD(P)-dependent oxidoreductase [Propionicimonas sp.]|jgi:3-hydroxyisobutyrate dehydrogenase
MTINSTRLGMVGVGVMGHGIASTLAGRGYPLVYLEHPGNQPTADLIAAGARPVATLADLAAAADVVILCVTGSPEVEAVLLGPDGLVASMRPGTLIIDHSTAIPSSTLRVADAVQAAGGHFLDAPMTGTPKDAEAGRVNLLVGADPVLFDTYRPLLEDYAARIVHAGPIGAGHQIKLLHNFVSMGFAAVLAEAVACAERAQVDIGMFMEVLANGGGKSTMLERLRPYIESRDDTAYRFSIGNAAKDLGYYTTLATELGAARGTAEAVHRLYADASAAGHARDTVPEMVTILAEPR